MLRFKISEVMARHGVQARDLAKELSIGEAAISQWKTGKKMPDIKRLDAIAAAITKLSKIKETVRGIDLLEDR